MIGLEEELVSTDALVSLGQPQCSVLSSSAQKVIATTVMIIVRMVMVILKNISRGRWGLKIEDFVSS